MRISASFLCLTGLFSLYLVADVYGHGTEQGSWSLIETNFDHCVEPSLTVVQKIYQ